MRATGLIFISMSKVARPRFKASTRKPLSERKRLRTLFPLGTLLIQAQVFLLAAASFQSTTDTMSRQKRESSIQEGRLSLDLSVPSMRMDASSKKIKNEKIRG